MKILVGYDGSDLAKKALKLAQEHVTETPFIILTGSMNEDTVVECMKAGASAFLLKPFRPDELIKLVAKIVAASG